MDAPGRTIANARRLRREMTLPEVLLWNAIRRGRIDGCKFRKQHPIGPFVLDFYCHEARLAVEVDGAIHTWPDQLRSDRRRDEWLAGQGIRVLRIPAKYVLDNLDGAFELIRAAVKSQN